MMKKLAVLMTAVLIVSATYSMIAQSRETVKKCVDVEIYQITASVARKIVKRISVQDAEQLKNIILEWSGAPDVKDVDSLKEKGLFWIYDILPHGLSSNDNISNSLCYFHAIGKGEVVLPIIFKIIEKINESLENITSLIGAMIVIIVMFALYAPLILIAYLIPFKLLAPVIQIKMDEGKMWTRGVEGFKKVEVSGNNSVSVKLRGFTGLVINIPSEDEKGFFFVSGFAASVKELGSK